MAKITWKPGTMLYPVPPALVSCGTVEKPNALAVAWTGIVCTDPAMTYVSIRPSRYSYELISASGEFVINLTDAALARAADFCGVRSGRDMDKFAAAGITAEPASVVSAPMVAESPVSLECRVKQVLPLGSHTMFLAEILAVHVREDLMEGDVLHLEKAHLVAYAHGQYYELGRHIGRFGFSVQKKTKPGHRKNGPWERK